MEPQQGATVPTSVRILTVSFGLSGPAKPISRATAIAMVRRHDVRMTLRGPRIKPTTAVCGSYSSHVGFVCKLRLPYVLTGRRHRYTLTACENHGLALSLPPASRRPRTRSPSTSGDRRCSAPAASRAAKYPEVMAGPIVASEASRHAARRNLTANSLRLRMPDAHGCYWQHGCSPSSPSSPLPPTDRADIWVLLPT
jgi:hypothetical protein